MRQDDGIRPARLVVKSGFPAKFQKQRDGSDESIIRLACFNFDVGCESAPDEDHQMESGNRSKWFAIDGFFFLSFCKQSKQCEPDLV